MSRPTWLKNDQVVGFAAAFVVGVLGVGVGGGIVGTLSTRDARALAEDLSVFMQKEMQDTARAEIDRHKEATSAELDRRFDALTRQRDEQLRAMETRLTLAIQTAVASNTYDRRDWVYRWEVIDLLSQQAEYVRRWVDKLPDAPEWPRMPRTPESQ